MHDCAGIMGLVAGMAECCLDRKLHWRDPRVFLLLWLVARVPRAEMVAGMKVSPPRFEQGKLRLWQLLIW